MFTTSGVSDVVVGCDDDVDDEVVLSVENAGVDVTVNNDVGDCTVDM